MKYFLALAIIVIIWVGFTIQKPTAILQNEKPVALKIENIDQASRNILIHSIAFQSYNHIQYAVIPADKFSQKKMKDVPDDLVQ